MARRIESPCPDSDCKAANPPQIPAADKLAKAGVSGDWVSGAVRCGHCDSVYSAGPDGTKTVRGFFDKRDVWHPRK